MKHLNDPIVNAIDKAWQKKELFDLILPELEELITDLLTGECIHYEDYDTIWQCGICYASIPAIYSPPGHLQALDPATFPHDETCPVSRARRIHTPLLLLPQKGETR